MSIQKLHSSAAEAGDLQMVAICEIAMYGEISERVGEALDDEDRAAIAKFANREMARAECERVLAA